MKKENIKVIIIALILIGVLILFTSTILFPKFWTNFYKEKNSAFEGELASLSGGYCTDSDGEDYNTRGGVNTNAGDYEDSCYDEKTLKEYYCEGRYSTYFLHNCVDGCAGGKCI